MKHLTFDFNDITSCIELACDGVNLHQQDQNKLEVIHKIMYALAEDALNNQAMMAQDHQFTIRLERQKT